ncbi:MAG TPA: amidohydrolase [Tissierellaceae bacterium]
MNEKIEQLVEKHLDDIVKIRRCIHENPELGMEENETSKLVAKELEKLGLEVETGVANTGVVGLLRGKEEGKTILLRADMDALPITEKTGLEFSSKNDGKMHACGHDVHTSILLGVAKVLTEMKDEIKGNIKFVFQPAEEMNPTGGARYMIEEGVLENPKVDAAFALHVWGEKVGTVAVRRGTMMAQSDRLFITVKGKASHASQPHNGDDAILAAAQILVALQSIISRNVDPMESAVITVGTIKGGTRYNVLCDEVVLEGTVRTFNEKVAEMMPGKIKNLAENIAEAMGCSAEVEYVKGYSMTSNNEELADIAIESFKDILGEENVIIPEHPASGSEDFSEFTKSVPSVFYWLGLESDKNIGKTTLHNPNLVVDEDCIPVGIKSMSKLALDYLK